MPSALKTMIFTAALLVTFLTETTGFPVSRSRANNSRKLSATVDISSLMSTGSYLDDRHNSSDVAGRLLQQNVKLTRNLNVEGRLVHPLLADSHLPAGSNAKKKNRAQKPAGIYQFPLHNDSIPSEMEAVISIQITKQDIQKPTRFIIEQKDNVVDGNFMEYNTELLEAIQAPMSFELHHLPTEGIIQPGHWMLVKDFIMDDYLFGELDESAREYFLQRILSGLILSQQTK